MEEKKIKIAILGAGISGLATAYWLNKNDKYDVIVYDIKDQPGGAMTTKKVGDYLIDFGTKQRTRNNTAYQRTCQ